MHVNKTGILSLLVLVMRAELYVGGVGKLVLTFKTSQACGCHLQLFTGKPLACCVVVVRLILWEIFLFPPDSGWLIHVLGSGMCIVIYKCAFFFLQQGKIYINTLCDCRIASCICLMTILHLVSGGCL